MRAADFAREVSGALLRDRLRAALTVAGIAVGSFAVAALLSLGAGVQGAIGDSLKGLGEDLVIVTPERSRSGALAGAAAQAAALTEADVRELRRLDAVQAVSGVVTARVSAAAGPESVTTTCLGVDAEYADVVRLELDEGGAARDELGASPWPVAVLGASVAARLFPDGDAVGRRIELSGHRVQVVGIARERGRDAGGADEDDFVLVPRSFARGQLVAHPTPDGIDAVFALAVPGEVDDAVEEASEALGRRRPGIELKDALAVNSMRGLMSASVAAAKLLTVLMGGMAAISVLVGGVGIVNVMLANVADRRLEIGLKLALGAPPVVIGLEFLAGAVAFALAGAVAGLLGAWMLLRLLSMAQVADVSLTPAAAALATALAGIVGVVAGAYPAVQAARLQPREILRDA